MNHKITELINGYGIEFPNGIIAKATRLRATSEGVKGELEIRQGDTLLLVPTSFNFSSEPTRLKFAKDLSTKLALQIEWKEIFDYLCAMIQELTRAGDPCEEIYADENTPPPEQLLDGIIYKGVQNVIFGEKGVNKSTLAYLLGICVTLPWEDNSLDLNAPDRPIRTLVLDWETDKEIFRYYMSRLQKGHNLPSVPIFYRRCSLPLAEDIEAIQTHIEKSRAELLIIDSLGAAAGGERGDLKGSESALLFNSALRKLKTTSLIIGQTAKGNDDGKRRASIYGATFFTYYARNILELVASYDDYSDTQHLALFHRECNLGGKMPPIGFRVEFNNGGITFEREPVSIAEFEHKVTTGARILETLKDGAMTQKELKELLDVGYSTVNTTLKRLAQKGKVIKIGNTWGLPAYDSLPSKY